MSYKGQQSRLPVLALGADPDSTPETPELWTREYQLQAVSLSSIRTAPTDSDPHLVFCGGPDQLRFMPPWPEDSVRLFVDWDETFLPSLVTDVAGSPQVAELIRNYPIERSGWADVIPNALVAALEGRSAPGASAQMAVRAWAAGLVVAQRKGQARRKLRKAGVLVREIPLGYTDMFVAGVKALAANLGWEALGEEESLLVYLAKRAEDITELKTTDLAYVGQWGKFQRQCGIRIALELGHAIGPVRSGYGGQGAPPSEDISSTYVNAMAAARFALCPPGNYAGHSFRLGEALMLGTLPVEVTRIISEPGHRHLGDLRDFTISAPTWRQALAQMDKMSEGERLKRVHAGRTAFVTSLAGSWGVLRNRKSEGRLRYE